MTSPLLVAAFLLVACGEAGIPATSVLQAERTAPEVALEGRPETASKTAPAAGAPARVPVFDPPVFDPPVFDPVVLRSYPHDTSAFTQGLFFAGGVLHESTGQRGESRIRRLDLRNGGASVEASLPPEVFGEGATMVGDRIVSLSWRAGRGFVHDAETLDFEGEFPVRGEGWGLAYDPVADRLVLSDGTPTLRFLDPDSYEETGRIEVTLSGRPVPHLNELEQVEDEVWANVWQQEAIVRIDPETGEVVGLIDVSRLYPAGQRRDPVDDVPNGIAYDPASKRLFLTGKRWPAIYEVRLEERRLGE